MNQERTVGDKILEFTILTKKSQESFDKVINFFRSKSFQDSKEAKVHKLEITHDCNDVFTVHVKGKVYDIEGLFNIEFNEYIHHCCKKYTANDRPPTYPSEIDGHIEHIIGFDQRPALKPYFTRSVFRPLNLAGTTSYFPPQQLAEAYKFPSSFTGKGQTIAIIELGGGYVLQYIKNYFAQLGIKAPQIISVSVDGGTNNPNDGSGANGEVYLDIEVIGCLAPDSKIVVYFTPNTFKGFYDAILAASNDYVNRPSIISISWGGPESIIDKQTLSAFNNLFYSVALKNISVFAASGDNGSTDGISDGKVHVDFPASSPYVTACGGTNLVYSNYVRVSETAWSTTGGGVSDYFAMPGYQFGTGVNVVNLNTGAKNRSLPDVSGAADPQTGYLISVDGNLSVIGGTSAVAPLWSALTSRLNQSLGRNLGFLNYFLYANPSCFFDITQGQNYTSPGEGYRASKGWDACTGLGTPNGVLLNNKMLATFRP